MHRRRPRSEIIVPNAPHHVMLRGNNRRRLFSYRGDYLRFLGFLAEASSRFAVPIAALVLMQNHVHLVVTPSDARSLASFVKRVAQRYAIHRNRARRGSGKLFEERYRSVAITDAAQLATTIAYVDLNPVRAGIVDDASAFAWSTCSLHTGRGRVEAAVLKAWTPHDWYIALGWSATVRSGRYRAWLADQRTSGVDLEAAGTAIDDHDDGCAPYSLRLERPDRTRVAESRGRYGKTRGPS